MKFLNILLVLLAAFSVKAQTTLINYNFNTGSNYDGLNGNPIANLNTSVNSDAVFSTAAGTTTQSQAFVSNNTAGNALVFGNISGPSVLKFDLVIEGVNLNIFKDYKIYFQTRRTATGASFINLYYSTDSSTFNLLQNIDLTTQPASQFNENLIDLTTYTQLNNSAKLIFRLEFGGASSTAGSCRLDNFQIQASCDQSSEPIQNVDSLTVSNTGCQRVKLNWKKGDGLKTLLIGRASTPVTSNPADFVSYSASLNFGSGSDLGGGQFVLFADTGNSVTVDNLNQNTTYYFKAFTFNENSICPNSANYLINGSEPITVATTGQCYDILSILVHACGAPESYNEMFRFKTGNEPINIFDLQVGGSSGNNPISWGKWPNNNLNFNGFYQSSYTQIKVDSINATITSCGILIEPPAGIIPPNSEVIVFTDTMVSPTANSFAALSDTLYAIFQKFTSNPSQGCFVNTTNSSLSAVPNGTSAVRNLALRSISNNNLLDQVSYDARLLVNTNYGTANQQIYGGGAAVNRGATVFFDEPGTPSYKNYGCKAPFIPFGINPTLTTVKSNNTLCTGDSILLQANPTGPYTSLQWSGGNGGTFITPAPGIDSVWYVATPADAGTISFSVNIVGYCGEIIDSTVTITVVRPTAANITPNGPTTFCAGNSVILQGNSGTGYSYSWLPGGETTQNITVTQSGQYTLNVTNICGSSTANINVVVNPNPSINVSANGPLTFCEGGNVSVTATLLQGTGYSWSFGGNAATVAIDSTVEIFAIAFDALNNCPNDTSNYLQITELNYPSIEAGTNISICAGNTVTIGSPAQTGITYTWTSNPVGFNSNNAQENVAPSATTTYYYEAGNGICKSYDTILVTVSNLVPTSVSISSDKGNTICQNENVTFSTNINGGGSNPTYAWYVNGVLLTNQTSNSFTTNTLSDGDQVYCVLTSSLSCASGSPATSNVITFTVKTPPSISISASGSTNICQGQSVTLTINGLAAGDTYTWSNGAPGTSITLTTSQTITLTVNNSCGQDVKSEVINVTPLPMAQIQANGPTTFCSGNSVSLGYNPQTGTIYSWSGGYNGNPITVSSAGWISLTGTNACGTIKDSVQIIVQPNVTASITASATKICNNDSILLTSSSPANNLWSTGQTTSSIWVKNGGNYTLTVSSANCGNATASIFIEKEVVNASFTASADTGIVPASITFVSNSTGATSYSWDFGNITNGTGATVTAEYNAPGVFTVILTATGNLGCKDTASKIIKISDPPVTLEFPNIFSPNNDGKFDVFLPIKSIGITEGLLEIYNRWGLKLYETNNLNFTWDGRSSLGDELPEGVYYYLAKVKTRSGTTPEIELKGYVTLVR